ncbi:NifU N-terminal domain-containing protein [Winogradskyella sp. 3972H.M.0a.05]|uniref:NifU family protein n=1 Tax=Winogradskyella sp. 3972H.M.0a.05 TaxID=2950277 RepID=UPI0033979DEC
MTSIKIAIKPTSNDSIVKFEANEFITQHQSYEFNNIDDAKPSPLAQQLFYLPFVKKVYISGNFIAIERYDIVQWADVQDDVAEQIESYLNSGGDVITANESNSNKKVPVTVYAESTPNPSVMKFVANKKLVLQPVEFNSIDDSKSAPFASELFHFPFVKGVFMDENFVSITKYDVAEWTDITMEIREFVRSYIETGKPILLESTSNSEVQKNIETKANFESLDDTSKQIVSILDEYIKPAVASDGGNIEFISFDANSKKVEVLLQGACSGCPSSTFTLKNGIENMLKEMLNDSSITVNAVNG